jgi:hypothetical protein
VAAIKFIEDHGGLVTKDVYLPPLSTLNFDGQDGLAMIMETDFPDAMEKFLSGYVDSSIKSVQDIVDFNDAHADLELPAGK